MSLEVFEHISQIFLLVLLGFVLRIFKIAGEKEAAALMKITAYTTLPALIFVIIHKTRLSANLSIVPIVALAVMFIITLIAFLLTRFIKKKDPKVIAPLLLTAAVGNTGYLGYPLTLKIFGVEGLAVAVIYDIFATVVFALTFGVYVFSKASNNSEVSSPNIFKQIVSFVPLQAAVIALILKPVLMPVPIMNTLEFLGSAAIPVILLAIGLSFKPIVDKSYLLLMMIVVGLKLLLSPLLVYFFGSLVLKGVALKVMVLEAAMPSMMLSYLLAEKFKLDTRFTGFAILLTTALSIVTIPLILLML